jgi:hypothetical protein
MKVTPVVSRVQKNGFSESLAEGSFARLLYREATLMNSTTRYCKRCNDEIPLARLRAIPDTVLCIDCSEEIGGDYKITVVPENLGKSGSLKKNYAAWSIKKTRRTIRPKER